MLQRYLPLFILLLSPLCSRSQAPVEFIRNEGQWAGPFTYRAQTGRGDVFLSDKSLTYLIGHPANSDRVEAVKHGRSKGPATLNFHVYRTHFEGASTPKISGGKEQSWYYNYFQGKDPARWKSGIHPALAVDYAGLYPGIDMHVASEEGQVKYEFIVSPGADPAAIRLRYEGQDGLMLKGGNLVIKTSVGEVQELKPYVYQYTDAGRKEVPCRYRIKDATVTYDLYDGYDASRPLVIDPTVVFATFTGSTADNWGYTATYDAQGNFYAGGIMLIYAGSPSGTFPTTTGAFQTTFASGVNDPNNQTLDDHGLGIACDIAIIKYNAAGTAKIYATLIGGTDNEVPHSMIVDANNNLVIGGKSFSNDYPVTAGCFDNTYNGAGDIVITKLNSTGTSLIGSTYMGGSGKDGTNFSGSEYVYGGLKYNYGDDSRSEVLTDNAGNIYLAGCSYSNNFPVLNAQQPSAGGGQDAVVMKLNATLTNLIWSTYLGGSGDDAGYVMALDNTQTRLYVGGGTMSSNFPFTAGTWKSSYQNGTDGYIARFQNGGTYPLQAATAIGTPNYDQVYGVQVDLENNVYAMGQSLGGAFPVTSGVYSNANSSQFIIKLDSNLATNIYSTVFGSSDPLHTNISPVAFLVDTCQNVYISGWGGNLDLTQFSPSMPTTIGTTVNMPVTPGSITAPLSATTDGFDFYFIVLSKNAQSLLYGAFYGRNSAAAGFGEHVDGGTSRFDKSGVIYQAICGGCGGTAGPPLPTTTGAFAPTNGSVNCNLASLKIAFQLGAVNAVANASPTAKGCPPFTVQFQNTSTNAVSYTWNFGDNTPTSSQATPSHTFQNVGVYTVRLIANNPNACKVLDTSYLTITVDSNSVDSRFNLNIVDSCGPWQVAFTNTSQYSKTPGAPNFTQFTWYFGDGNSYTGTTPPVHSYAGPGTYTITLVMRDSTSCNSPDTMRKTVSLNGSKVTAGFNAPDSICISSQVDFTNISINATGSSWRFGDGQTSTLNAPSHTFTAPGTYTVWLVSTNPNSCNKRDSASKTIKVKPGPIADFSFSPTVPVANLPIQFTNLSQGATSYAWNFGDGTGSNAVNPSHLFRRTGIFNVCLVAKSTEGCADTVCKKVEADVRTLADLPTAFSPNGDGSNDIFLVRGGAIETMNLKIFNRWGELVYEGTNPETGWDGTYKGKPQEMDAYAFVLHVTFIDGTTMMKKGNVTLIR